MRRILIIGATSAIAEATARQFAARGDALFLVGRDASRLKAIADDLGVRGAVRTATASLEVTDFAAHAAVLEQADRDLGGLDTVLIAHGTLSNQRECEESVETLRREFDINALSVMALLTPLANRFAAQGHGTIAVISSVAGDRGRMSNYAYGAAKAAVSAFLSGLRQRLQKSGVNVLTIKPGFVDTPMTRDFPKGALWAKPEDVAKGIVNAIDKGRSVAYLPWFWSLIMLVIKHVPEFLFKRVKL
ncbi:SDR family oxidoreductase [Tahibacter amnicola]|uniref:SDR family oxidoreductase n=1 Tax=Tahibacter amnicola TaxID=2976241 RepID=A0ABY6BHA0_9GAMM|nr:SDR family oxidoreductase [Tahibacter amnicola]MCU7374986.1 SDR family oxidoreductase [Paucibacter sp. O1-1]MDA3829988.1 SDR family oxidoreductase [Paucibacter sp. O1-1]UXI69225.1 SDR family oxidoreductase [Tahibacter amnicola]